MPTPSVQTDAAGRIVLDPSGRPIVAADGDACCCGGANPPPGNTCPCVSRTTRASCGREKCCTRPRRWRVTLTLRALGRLRSSGGRPFSPVSELGCDFEFDVALDAACSWVIRVGTYAEGCAEVVESFTVNRLAGLLECRGSFVDRYARLSRYTVSGDASAYIAPGLIPPGWFMDPLEAWGYLSSSLGAMGAACSVSLYQRYPNLPPAPGIVIPPMVYPALFLGPGWAHADSTSYEPYPSSRPMFPGVCPDHQPRDFGTPYWSVRDSCGGCSYHVARGAVYTFPPGVGPYNGSTWETAFSGDAGLDMQALDPCPSACPGGDGPTGPTAAPSLVCCEFRDGTRQVTTLLDCLTRAHSHGGLLRAGAPENCGPVTGARGTGLVTINDLAGVLR